MTAIENIDHVIEIRGVYDGWSVAVLTDGTWVNRWAEGEWAGSRRDYETELYITEHGPRP